MTPHQALQILDAATDPRNAGRLNRSDYIQCQAALEALAALHPIPSATDGSEDVKKSPADEQKPTP